MLRDMGPFRRKNLNGYTSRMSSPNPHGEIDWHVAEILEQQGFKWEEEPASVYEPQQLYDALERYATDWSRYEHMDECLEFGFRMAFKIFAKPKDVEYLQPLDDITVATKALKLGKNAGLPLMVSKAESLSYSFNRERQIRLMLKVPNPCVAFKRTQRGNKTRLVWGFPLEMTIMEARFARPLIDWFLKARTTMAFGLSKFTLGAYLHRYIVEGPGRIVAMDYSKYDSTVPALLIKRAFSILATWFSKENRKELGWDIIVKYFIHTPIVMPDGHLYCGKNHGVPSGSYFTQMIDSIVNTALSFALSMKFHFGLSKRSLFVLGDDVIASVQGKVDLSKWSEYLASFGMKLNVLKTKLDIPHFLGAVWSKGKPDVPIQDLVQKGVNPESYRDYKGQPRKGAHDVLRSYACISLSGIRLLPLSHSIDMRRVDMPDDSKIDPSYLSGFERWNLEERQHLGFDVTKLGPASITVRFMS